MSTLGFGSRETTPVVRSKMLLEVRDVAAELDIERVDVLRLIARGNLKSRVVGADKLRVEWSGIEALLRQDVELEIGSTFNEWFDSPAEELRAGEMVGKIKHAIAAVIPEEDPGADQVVRYTRRIAEVGNATPRPMQVSIPGSRELPYRNVAEMYVVVQLRRMARQEVNRRATTARVEGRKARSPLEILYSTPEAHRAIVDESLWRFAEKSISVRHDYPEATRTFSLMHTALPTNLDTAVRLAFWEAGGCLPFGGHSLHAAAAGLTFPVVAVSETGKNSIWSRFPYRIHQPHLGTVSVLATEGEQMPGIDIETLIRQRAEFLKRHPRPGDFGVAFNRDFMEQHGLPLLCEIDNYDSGGWVQCTCQALLGYAGSEADRKRLQRGLKKLLANGTIERSGRSSYRLKSEQVAKV